MSYIQHQLLQKYKELNELNKYRGCGLEDDANVALTNYEIDDILGGETKVLTYKNLPQFSDIDQILEPYKNFIMLYMWRPNYGHWICVLKHPDRIEFFDPYGEPNEPDTELDKVPDDVKEITNQDYPYLSKLIYDSGLPIEYNNYPFQELHEDIKTCGRHCVVRVLFKQLLLDEYYDMMNAISEQTGLNYDQIVTLITTK